MFLIDYPYASEFLVKTIRKNKYRVVETEVAKKMLQDVNLDWISEKQAVRKLIKDPFQPLITNSENALGWITNRLPGTEIAQQALFFKDKFRFRELIRDLNPGFQFRTVSPDEISKLDPEALSFPFVLKPSVGFFSLGVHIVNDPSEWEKVKKEPELQNPGSLYPRSVLDASTFLIEEYISGEEYAIDCYFNGDGDVVILNILHHRFSSGTDTSDRVYSTSKDIILDHREMFRDFLQKIGRKAKLKNFPAHVEVRMDAKGQIRPIEINPLRFGGWCTTADLLGMAVGYNSYEYYIRNQKPDWNKIFENKSQQTFSIIVLNNNSGYRAEEITDFNYDQLGKDFERPLEIRRMDPGKYSVFGFLFAETSPGRKEELDRILISDLRKYITVK